MKHWNEFRRGCSRRCPARVTAVTLDSGFPSLKIRTLFRGTTSRRGAPFNHEGPFIGRDQQLERLRTFIDGTEPLLLLKAPGAAARAGFFWRRPGPHRGAPDRRNFSSPIRRPPGRPPISIFFPGLGGDRRFRRRTSTPRPGSHHRCMPAAQRCHPLSCVVQAERRRDRDTSRLVAFSYGDPPELDLPVLSKRTQSPRSPPSRLRASASSPSASLRSPTAIRWSYASGHDALRTIVCCPKYSNGRQKCFAGSFWIDCSTIPH